MENTHKKEREIEIHAHHAQHPELYLIRCEVNQL